MEQIVKRRRTGAMVAVVVSVAALSALGLLLVYGFGTSRSDRASLGSDLAVEETLSDGRTSATASTTTSTIPATTTTVVADVAQSSTAGADAGSTTTVDGEVRTYTMAGGEIVLAFNEDNVQLVSVALNDGFTVETHEVGNELHVNLRDGVRHSAVVAWVEDGPQVLLDDH